MSGSNSSVPSSAAQPRLPDSQGRAAPVSGQRKRSGRFKLGLLLLVCAAPVVASYFTYYVIKPEGRRNYGELIEPQRPLPEVMAHTLDGKPVPLTELKGQWLLLQVDSGTCAKACEDKLYLQRQLRESLGREKERVDRVWLIGDEQPVPAALANALGQATVLRVPQAVLAGWLAAAPGQALADHLYVVDPMGHWMMRFPAGMDVAAAGKAKRDLERLMKGSSSWDQPGRVPDEQGKPPEGA